jgi:hypothetical protein
MAECEDRIAHKCENIDLRDGRMLTTGTVTLNGTDIPLIVDYQGTALKMDCSRVTDLAGEVTFLVTHYRTGALIPEDNLYGYQTDTVKGTFTDCLMPLISSGESPEQAAAMGDIMCLSVGESAPLIGVKPIEWRVRVTSEGEWELAPIGLWENPLPVEQAHLWADASDHRHDLIGEVNPLPMETAPPMPVQQETSSVPVLYLRLFTYAGDEASYPGYAPIPVPIDADHWKVSKGSATLEATARFGEVEGEFDEVLAGFGLSSVPGGLTWAGGVLDCSLRLFKYLTPQFNEGSITVYYEDESFPAEIQRAFRALEERLPVPAGEKWLLDQLIQSALGSLLYIGLHEGDGQEVTGPDYRREAVGRTPEVWSVVGACSENRIPIFFHTFPTEKHFTGCGVYREPVGGEPLFVARFPNGGFSTKAGTCPFIPDGWIKLDLDPQPAEEAEELDEEESPGIHFFKSPLMLETSPCFRTDENLYTFKRGPGQQSYTAQLRIPNGAFMDEDPIDLMKDIIATLQGEVDRAERNIRRETNVSIGDTVYDHSVETLSNKLNIWEQRLLDMTINQPF